MIAAGIVSVACTISVLVMFGRMCRAMMTRVARTVRDRRADVVLLAERRALPAGDAHEPGDRRRFRARASHSSARGRGWPPGRRRGSGTGRPAARRSARMITGSTSRGSSPETRPKGTATAIASSVARTPASIEARAPKRMRESTSRPSSSVPSQCSLDGDANSASKSVASGSYGASDGREDRGQHENEHDASADDRERPAQEAPEERSDVARHAWRETTAGCRRRQAERSSRVPPRNPDARIDQRIERGRR